MKQVLEADLLAGSEDVKVDVAFGTDLVSDILAFYGKFSNTLLLTGLNNLQVIRTAELLDISAIIFVRGKTPNQDIVKLARERNISLLVTRYTMYEASGMLFNRGLMGINTMDDKGSQEFHISPNDA